ncbi:hypothetical protein ACFWF7_44055 [Nocardia sp. NPDC060256]|uniref:hypothetical protein n=1 Tax=unclassified Nocardia TaxID=2637762 RepID=UPI00366182E1
MSSAVRKLLHAGLDALQVRLARAVLRRAAPRWLVAATMLVSAAGALLFPAWLDQV